MTARKKDKPGKARVSPLRVEMTFEEFMAKAAWVPNPRTKRKEAGPSPSC